MRKIIVKIFISCVILFFCVTNLHAQYTVFQVKGAVTWSVDGKSWNPINKKDELKESYQLNLQENSLIHFIDSNSFIYSCSGPKVASVTDIVKQRKTILQAMNENFGKRRAIGGVERGETKEDFCQLLFTETESLNPYDSLELIAEGSVFYITIVNKTQEERIVAIYEQLDNKELIQCFPNHFKIEKYTTVEIKELLFGKQTNQKFVIIY